MKTITFKNYKKILIPLFLLMTIISHAQTQRTYTTSGSFVAPAGVTNIQVEAYGAGGGGGYGGTSNKDGGGGGGGGGYSKNVSVSVTAGTTYTVTIGAQGTGATTSGTPNGTSGGNTTATFGATTVTANGGIGGFGYTNGGAGGTGGTGSTFIGGSGGAGLNGTGSGGGGGAAGSSSNGGNGSVPTGGTAGGGSAGAGGNGTIATSGSGSSSITNYGGGGGGGTKNSAGGNGAGGYIIITYTCPTYALTNTTSSNSPLCGASSASVTLNSSSLASGTYTVTYNLSGATTATGNTSTMSFTAGSLGSGTFSTSILNLGSTTVTITNLTSSYCNNSISTFNSTNVTVNSSPNAISGTAITACSSNTAIAITAGASATNYTTVTWTSSGTGVFTNANSLTTCTYNPSAADIMAGSVILTLTASNPGCANATSTKTLTLITAANAIAGTNLNTCSTSGAVNITAGSSVTNYISVAWTSSGTGTFVNANSLTTCTYTPSAADITAGSVILTLTASGNAPCGNVTSTKILTINSPMTAIAGANLNTCSTSGINITAGSSATNQTTVTWTSSGTGTFTNPNSLTTCTYTPSAADLTAGSITITLTTTNAGCAIASSSKTLSIQTPPTSVAGTALSTCSTAGAINITAGSSATNQIGQTWTSSGTGTFVNANSLTLCTYTPSAADISAGSITLTLTATGNVPCSNVTSSKTLTINNPMTAVAGSAVTTCATSGAVNITSGSSATNQTLVTWTSSGTGTFANPNSLTTCTYTPSAADISAGSVILTLTASNSGCANATASKMLTISPLPTAIAGTAVNTCSTNGAVNITAGSSATNYTSIVWISSGTGIFVNANSLTTCTYTPSAADITAGTVTLTLTANGNAPCSNITSTKTLTISNPMTAVAGSNFSICYSGGAVNITAGSSATNQTLVTWTSSGTGTFTNPNSLTTCTYSPSAADITAGSVILTLTASNSGCTNATASKTLTISSQPTAIAGTAVNTCSINGAVNITAGSSATNYTSISWTSSGTGTFANANSLTTCTYTPSVLDISAGSITLTLTANANAPCSNITSTKTLTISNPMTAIAGSNFSNCYSSGSINITTGSSAINQTSITWASNGTGTFANANSLTTCTYTPSAADRIAGSVIFTLTASNAGCTNATASKTLTISTPPTPVAGTTINTCSTTGAVNITAGSSATNYTSTAWTSNGTGTFTNASSLTTCTYNPSVADITTGSVTLTLTANGNAPCAAVTSSKNLIISLPPTAAAGSNFSTCYSSGSINITSGSSATNQTSVTWTSNGTGTFTNTNSLTTCTYTPSAADITAGNVIFTLTASNAGCTNANATKTLTIRLLPTAIAGTAINTCSSNGAVNITAGSSATNYTSVAWTSSGTGTFANASSLTTCTYNPSAADITAGSATLTLTANGNAPCTAVTNTKTINISRVMTAVAGSAFTACSSNTAINVTSGSSATNQTNITWTSNGTGTFTNPNSLTTCTYTPSTADVIAGSVIITLTVSNTSCPNVTSNKTLTFIAVPAADAGSDVATCSTCGTVNITANSAATNYTSIAWTSSGTGTFTNANSLTACTYTPSAADITNSMNLGAIVLTLTVTGNAPCSTSTSTKLLGITNQTFTSSGTFTVPSGVYQVTVEGWGGGGKGGDGLNIGNVGGGGGGGAYSSKSIAVVPGTTYIVNVGLGATTVSDGGDSWFIDTTTLLAKGGTTALNNASTGGAGGSVAACIGDITSRGGNGANGSSGNYGGGGGAGAEASENAGVDGTTNLGAIAICNGGNGGNGYTSSNGDGSPGLTPGGGGGGGRRNGNNGVNQGTGGFGADGKIIIKWPINPLISTVTNAPGGVTSNLQLWLRSDLVNGTTTMADNTPISTWYTQARGANAIKPSAVGSPIYRNNAAYNINFNAVVDFTNPYNSPSPVTTDLNSSRQYLKGTNGYYSEDTFVVVIPDVTVTSALNNMDVFSGKSTVCGVSKSGISYGNVDSRFSNEVLSYTLGATTSYGTAQVSTTSQYNNPGIINIRNNSGNTGMQLYYNANNIATTEVNASKHRIVYDSQYWIGRSEQWDGSLDGRIAEVITYSSRKNDATERTKIESYLGVKYGITLGVNGTSKNYLASDGTVIWDASANAGYNYDIAGIGRDDISKLNQKQSKSVNTNANLTIGLGAIATTNTANTNGFDTDKKYLIWGDNGGNMNNSGTNLTITFGGTSSVTTLTDIPNKKWKIVETGGDVATAKVAIPTSALASLPALSGNDAYVMIVASDAVFTTNLETIFIGVNGSNYETDYDFDGTKFFTFGVAHVSTYSRHASFDGIDDSMKVSNSNNLNSTFSMMTWVRPTGANTLANDRTIVSKYNGTTGYRVYLSTTNRVVVTWAGGTTLTSATALPSSEWHNIAIIYSSGSIKLYIDGVLDSTVASAAPASSTNTFSIGAEYRSKSDTRNFFNGDIDEFRLWDKAITLTELKFVMNQEILQNATGTKGAVLPTAITKNDISTLNWSNLQAYYSMNSFIGTHIDDDSQNSNRGNVFSPNKTTITTQSSPQPYQSSADGAWSSTGTWSNGTIQQLPNSLSIVDGVTPIDWNIVKTSNNVGSAGNKTVLGLFVTANTLSATNDTKIQVSHYLKIDGKIDLVGKSQLIQTINSDLDVTSAGSIERDQKGQSNRFNYNYWSSPVGSLSTTSNNNSFTVNGVLRDATNPASIQNITWTTGYNSAATTPITLSSYWIFKFQNLTPQYANWASVGPNGTLQTAQGYTMKGSDAATATQNYTFVGKPNNGLITSPIAPNNANLSGNPYASALDANAFITANSASTTGAIYFWEHFPTNVSHNLLEYQGGYAARTLVGGTPPVSPAGVSGLGSSTRVPGRYIPVGQGFLLYGSATGGNITFDNSQRAFIKEDSGSSNPLFRQSQNGPTVEHVLNNQEDVIAEDTFAKIRLGFNSANSFHRQLLLGFMNENATSGYDLGYDAPQIDQQPNEMVFLNGESRLVIQGDGYFNSDNIYPLAVTTSALGNINFTLDATENFDDNQGIYIYDSLTSLYHDIREEAFTLELPQGTISDRFSLRFKTGSLATTNFEAEADVVVKFTNADNMINIQNKNTDLNVNAVTLFTLLGQNIGSWDVKNDDQSKIQIPVKNLSTGTYIVKVTTTKGDITKKIIIK